MTVETNVRYRASKSASISKYNRKNLNRNKLPSEIERWAMGLDDDDNASSLAQENDLDEYDFIDESYLKQMDPDDKEKYGEDNASDENGEQKSSSHLNFKEERYFKIKEILDKIKKGKEPTKPFFSSSLSEVDNNKNQKHTGENKYKLYLEKEKKEELEKKRIRDERRKKSNDNSFKLKSINNGMTRAVPGSLQQNITIERTFFKDLMKLSHQRYLSKLSSEFYKRRFLAVQSRKGLVSPNGDLPNYTEPASSLIKSKHQTDRKLNSALPLKTMSKLDYQTTSNDSMQMRLGHVKSFSALGTASSDSTKSQPKLSNENFSRKVKIDLLNIENEPISKISKNRQNSNQEASKQTNAQIKRPMTSIATLNQFSKSISNMSDFKSKENSIYSYETIKQSDELDDGDDDDDDEKLMRKIQTSKPIRPLSDTRFTKLFESMNDPYESKQTNSELDLYDFSSIRDPNRRVSVIIGSNKALQGPGWNGSIEKEKNNLTRIESNKKLFERMATNFF